MPIAVALIAMCLATVLPRVLPLLLVRRPLDGPRLGAFLRYVPYAVLAAMIVPDILHSTASVASAAAGSLVALVLAIRRRSLIVVACGGAAAVLIVDGLTLLLAG